MKTQIKAYFVYLTVLAVLLVPVMVYVTNLFGEAVARSTLLTLVIAIAPLSKLQLPWWIRIVMTILVAMFVVTGQAYVAYGVHHYNNEAEIPTVWLFGAVIYYVCAWWISEYAARRLVFPEFGSLNLFPTNRGESGQQSKDRG